MPKVAILFVFLLISPLFTNSHAFPIDPFISLDDTSNELNILKSEIEGFDSTLVKASDKIDKSTGDISASVDVISEASSQLNSLLFPIIASIGIIVALQITIIARRR